MTETWLPVISRPESYEVSSLGRIRCSQGHAYDGSNTYVGPKGWRGCRACRAEASRRHGRKVGVQP